MERPVVGLPEIIRGLDDLGIDRARPVIAHASLSAFGNVNGGAQIVVQALLSTFDSLVMPAFTYKTMLTPETGPAQNGMTYGSQVHANTVAKFFKPEMPVDRLIGAVAEALRTYPLAQRSMHPIQSFVGVNAADVLQSQSLEDPLAPLRVLFEQKGWVLLLGVDHTVNTSIHYAEKRAGRRQFVRWALTKSGVVECPSFPGCSDGFEAIAPYVEGFTRRVRIGRAEIRAVALPDLVGAVEAMLHADPLALLCEHSYCERCAALRTYASG